MWLRPSGLILSCVNAKGVVRLLKSDGHNHRSLDDDFLSWYFGNDTALGESRQDGSLSAPEGMLISVSPASRDGYTDQATVTLGSQIRWYRYKSVGALCDRAALYDGR